MSLCVLGPERGLRAGCGGGCVVAGDLGIAGDRSSTRFVLARGRELRSRFLPRLLLLRRCPNGWRCFHMHWGVGRARELL